MDRKDKDIERRIVRRIDGESTPDEKLELDRELIRDPDARQMFDAYQRIDELAADVLSDVLPDVGESFDPSTLAEQTAQPRRRRLHRGFWLVPGAIAAALLAIVVPRPGVAPEEQPAVVQSEPATRSAIPQMQLPYASSNGYPRDGVMRNAGNQGRVVPRVRSNTGRDVLGVIGDDGNIYWIEVDRTRTIRRPGRDERTGALDEM